MNVDYFGNVQRLRLAQVIALSLAIVTLYIESGTIGFFGFLFPSIVAVVQLYFALDRYMSNFDGALRFVPLVPHQLAYAIAPLFLSVLLYFMTPTLPSAFFTLIFVLARLTAMGGAAGVLALDLYSGFMARPVQPPPL